MDVHQLRLGANMHDHQHRGLRGQAAHQRNIELGRRPQADTRFTIRIWVGIRTGAAPFDTHIRFILVYIKTSVVQLEKVRWKADIHITPIQEIQPSAHLHPITRFCIASFALYIVPRNVTLRLSNS